MMIRSRCLPTFVIFMLQLTCDEAIVKRYTEKDVCSKTIETLERVTVCPKNYTAFIERSLTKRCNKYPKCQGQILMYHCVRYNDYLVEVCTRPQLIIGRFCPVFEGKLGLVIADETSHCSTCPEGYISYNFSKYQECVQIRQVASTYQKPVVDAETYGNTTLAADPTSSINTTENSINEGPRREEENDQFAVVMIGVIAPCFIFLCVGICKYRKGKRKKPYSKEESSIGSELQELNESKSSVEN